MKSSVMQRIEKNNKRRQDRKQFIEIIKHRLTDETFVRESRKKYWSRLTVYSLIGLLLIFLAITSYPYLVGINHYFAVMISIVFFLLAIFTLVKSKRCGACNGEVASGPAYCYECGLTYWLHKQGLKAYKKRLDRLKEENILAKVAEDKVIAEEREKNKGQYEFLERAENILRVNDTQQRDDEMIKLADKFDKKKN